MQKVIFAFLMVIGVSLAADTTITDKVREQQIPNKYIYILSRQQQE